MMLFSKHSACAGLLLTLYGVANAASNFKLYAIGAGVTGPVIYGDGIAYIGYAQPPSNISKVTNVTFTRTSSSGSSSFVVTPDNSDAFNSTSSKLVINTKPGAFEPVKLVSNNSDTTSSGFDFYGHDAVYWSEEEAESKWWATTTETDGLWILKWNVDGTNQPNSVPVVVKDRAPVTHAYSFVG